MGECRILFASSSNFLKTATAVSVLALFLHIVAFSTPNWSTVHLMFHEELTGFGGLEWLRSSDHAGLWKICSCLNSYHGGDCICRGRHGDPVWFKMTQAMEAIALVGLIISGTISVIQLCVKQDTKLKRINIFINIGSGLCGLLGLVIYGIRSQDETDDILAYFDEYNVHVDGYIGYSFYVCCFSMILYVMVCAPLYIKDEKLPIPTVTQEHPTVYNSRGQIVFPSEFQGTTHITDIGQDNAGHFPTITQGSYYPPPAYSVNGESDITEMQHVQDDHAISYKA